MTNSMTEIAELFIVTPCSAAEWDDLMIAVLTAEGAE
jgi:hypothetical protein